MGVQTAFIIRALSDLHKTTSETSETHINLVTSFHIPMNWKIIIPAFPPEKFPNAGVEPLGFVLFFANLEMQEIQTLAQHIHHNTACVKMFVTSQILVFE